MIRRRLPCLFLSLLVSAAALPEQPRVFYSPAERPGITAKRRVLSQESLAPTGEKTAVTTPAPEHSEKTAPAPATPPRGRLDGISLARDGKAYAWISGRRYDDGSLYAGRRLQVSRDGIRLQGNLSQLIRVGEVLP